MAHLRLGRGKLLGVEVGVKLIGGELVNEVEQDAVAIFGTVVPDKEKVVERVEVGSTEEDEVVEGEVVGDGQDQEERAVA